ncbi:MAG: hypothetical protein ACKVS9_17815 [Phycisphaerae bacterium]
MKSRHSRGRRDFAAAAELHADDGVDPRTAFSRKPRGRNGSNWKDAQVAGIARRALEAALASHCDDPLVGELQIEAIEVGGGGHLRVLVRAAGDAAHQPRERIAERLKELSGFLRAEVARDLNRRRAAELSFVVVPPIGGDA